MNRVKLRFADLEIEFTDRDRGIRQIYEWVERGLDFHSWYLALRVVVKLLGLNKV